MARKRKSYRSNSRTKSRGVRSKGRTSKFNQRGSAQRIVIQIVGAPGANDNQPAGFDPATGRLVKAAPGPRKAQF